MTRWTPSKHPRDSNGMFKGVGGRRTSRRRTRFRAKYASDLATARAWAVRDQAESDRIHGKGTFKVTGGVTRYGLFGRKTRPNITARTTSAEAQKRFLAHEAKVQAMFR